MTVYVKNKRMRHVFYIIILNLKNAILATYGFL